VNLMPPLTFNGSGAYDPGPGLFEPWCIIQSMSGKSRGTIWDEVEIEHTTPGSFLPDLGFERLNFPPAGASVPLKAFSVSY
jgi:hypothetical protein